MADWNAAAGESEDDTPVIPDGGLGTSMPEWLKVPPAWATAADERPLPAPDNSPIDPATLVREEDIPVWMRNLSRHMRERAAAEVTLPDLAIDEEEPAEPASGESWISPAENDSLGDTSAEDDPAGDTPEERGPVEKEPAKDMSAEGPATRVEDGMAANPSPQDETEPEPAASSDTQHQGVLVNDAWDPRAVPVMEASGTADTTGPHREFDYHPVVIEFRPPSIVEIDVEVKPPSGTTNASRGNYLSGYQWRDPVVLALLGLAVVVILVTIYLL